MMSQQQLTRGYGPERVRVRFLRSATRFDSGTGCYEY